MSLIAGARNGRAGPGTTLCSMNCKVGVFTPEGAFASAARKLDHLVELGVTAVEIMPVADFRGRWGWGYDGVYPYAPDSTYGRPEDFKYFVEAAHRRGVAVLVDVVYNHFGPEGNYLSSFAPDFFTDRHRPPWGKAINFDGAAARRGDAGEERLLCRLWRDEAPRQGASGGIRLPRRHLALSGSAVRRRERRASSRRFRRLHPEPRPDRQPRVRRAADRACLRVRQPGARQRLSPPAADADAVHGRGMGVGAALPVLLRFRRRTGGSRPPGTP